MPRLPLIPVLVCVTLLLACTSSPAMDRITGEPFASRSVVYAPQAMAATSHPLATQIALDTMKAGTCPD